MTNPALAYSLYWMKYVNVTRSLRVFRMFKKMQEWEVTLSWDINPIVWRALRIIIGIILWLSLNGCIFYMIANLENLPWEWIYVQDVNPIVTKGPWFKYLTSLYWSIMVFSTVGYGDISATTNGTRGFVILLAIINIGLLAYSTGNVVTWLQSAEAKRTLLADKLDLVKDYVQYRDVGEELTDKILKFHRFKGFSNTYEGSDGDLMLDLSPDLRSQLAIHFRETILRNWGLPRICSVAFLIALILRLKRETKYPQEYVTLQGSPAKKFYILTSGRCSVIKNGEVIMEMVCPGGDSPGATFGELSLFSDNSRRPATLRAAASCEFLCLKRSDLQNLLKIFPEYAQRINIYASQLQSTFQDANLKLLHDIKAEDASKEKSTLRNTMFTRLQKKKENLRGSEVFLRGSAYSPLEPKTFLDERLNDIPELSAHMASELGAKTAEFSAVAAVDWFERKYELPREDGTYLGKQMLRMGTIYSLSQKDFEDKPGLRFRFSTSTLETAIERGALPDFIETSDIRGAVPTSKLRSMVNERNLNSLESQNVNRNSNDNKNNDIRNSKVRFDDNANLRQTRISPFRMPVERDDAGRRRSAVPYMEDRIEQTKRIGEDENSSDDMEMFIQPTEQDDAAYQSVGPTDQQIRSNLRKSRRSKRGTLL